jgi:hypothetical protein
MMSHGVEKQSSFMAFLRVFQWEDYLVVCPLRKGHVEMRIQGLESHFKPKRAKIAVINRLIG